MNSTAIMHNISFEEIETIKCGINLHSRVDGRSLLQKRKIQIQKGNIPQASGSATATLESTMVLVGIHASTISTTGSQYTLLVDPSNPLLYDLLTKLLDTIPWNFTYVNNSIVWHFNIDLLVLSEGSGVEFCSWSAITAALSSLKLPQVSIMKDQTILLDETEATIIPFKNTTFIDLTTIAVFESKGTEHKYCVDPTLEEALGCSTLIHVGHDTFAISLFYQSKSSYLSTTTIQDIQKLL